MYKPAKRGRPPRRRPSPPPPSKITLSIGNCRVDLPTSSSYSLDANGLSINMSDIGTIDIKVASESPSSISGFSFTLLNPKTLDGLGKLVLQEVLKLYTQELPAMNYAANTGKESRFLENCILSGKYCTLILRNEELELIGAMTYQILPTDAHQAELPLAAVAQSHHRKGYGACLYKELQRRLLGVGVISIFCWGDQESETFWAKQGFVIVAEVDGRGKPWKLPIKADVRRAMSIPGSATLMISYLSSPSIQSACTQQETSGKVFEKTNSMETSPPRLNSLPLSVGGYRLSPPLSVTTPQVGGEAKSSQALTVTPVQHAAVESASSGKGFCATVIPLNMEGRLLSVAGTEDPKMAVAKNSRPPLASITNTVSATRPPKKRPFIRAGQGNLVDKPYDPVPASGTTTTLDGIEETAPRKEDTETETRPVIKELSNFGRKGLKGGEQKGVQLPTSGVTKEGQVEVILDRGTSFTEASKSGMGSKYQPAVDPGATIGVKRSRASLAQTNVCGRRSTRSRKADPVPHTPTVVDGIEDPTNEETEKSMPKEDADELQLMVNLLLPQQSNGVRECVATDVEKSSTRSRQKPGIGMNRTTSSISRPITRINGEGQKTSRMEAGSAAEAPLHQSNCIESNSSPLKESELQSTIKFPLETLRSCTPGQSSKQMRPTIMFMNMADETQKKQLTKYVERLTGEVTCNGWQCTHVVTGEVRRTLNFCVAISSGAFILSPDWLKMSVKQKCFADEARFVLRDRKFEAKYKVSLQDVILRAKQRPNLLLEGMSIFPTPHIHPPVDTISQIVEAAGGKILGSLEEAMHLEDKSHVAAIACEEDMSQAMSAAKAGLFTFSSDWLLTCIVKQELELTATQFSESL